MSVPALRCVLLVRINIKSGAGYQPERAEQCHASDEKYREPTQPQYHQAARASRRGRREIRLHGAENIGLFGKSSIQREDQESAPYYARHTQMYKNPQHFLSFNTIIIKTYISTTAHVNAPSPWRHVLGAKTMHKSAF